MNCEFKFFFTNLVLWITFFFFYHSFNVEIKFLLKPNRKHHLILNRKVKIVISVIIHKFN